MYQKQLIGNIQLGSIKFKSIKKYIIPLLIIIILGFMLNEFVKVNDNTLTEMTPKEYGQVYDIPPYYKYNQIKIKIYSYDNGWNLEKNMILDHDEIKSRQLCINFYEEDGTVYLNYKNKPILTLENNFSSSSSIYSLNDRLINDEETPLIMCIRFDEHEMGESKYQGYIDENGKKQIDFDKYQLKYPLIIEEPAKATLVTYQFMK